MTDTVTLRVEPGGAEPRAGAYDVIIGSRALGLIGPFTASMGSSRRVLIIHDAAVGENHLAAVTSTFPTKPAHLSWNPSEAGKSLDGASHFLDWLARDHFDRRAVVIALGGGITGDVAGFVAAVYQRGIAWINCPTTLLSMVDSAIGGKTGVNLALHSDPPTLLKNMIGAVHHPSLVVADIDTLATLPRRTFRSGLAECIKHAMIGADWGDPGLMDWTASNIQRFLDREAQPLCDLIARSITLKAAVVAADERELSDAPGGGRMALNLGHTFAHAIETLNGLSWPDQLNETTLQHGEAVGLGLIAASRCAERMGLVPGAVAEEVTRLVAACRLPTAVRGLPEDPEILNRMSHDKKARSGALRLVLPVDRGRVRVVSNPPPEAIRAGLAAIRG